LFKEADIFQPLSHFSPAAMEMIIPVTPLLTNASSIGPVATYAGADFPLSTSVRGSLTSPLRVFLSHWCSHFPISSRPWDTKTVESGDGLEKNISDRGTLRRFILLGLTRKGDRADEEVIVIGLIPKMATNIEKLSFGGHQKGRLLSSART
jgi:hypothetical protein